MVTLDGNLPPAVPAELLARAAAWPSLKRWERRALAVDLRALGLSYREIGAVIPVGRGSLSAWCRDIVLSDEQRARLASKRPTLAARRAAGERRRAKALARAKAVRETARAEAASLVREPFWVAGVVAYWAEGAKTCNELVFSNSDPAMIRLFIRWAQAYLDVDAERFTAKLHLHTGQDDQERKSNWAKETGIPVERFTKTYVKPEGSGHRKNILWAGTMSVRIRRSTSSFHRVMGWISGLSETLPPSTLAAGR